MKKICVDCGSDNLAFHARVSVLDHTDIEETTDGEELYCWSCGCDVLWKWASTSRLDSIAFLPSELKIFTGGGFDYPGCVLDEDQFVVVTSVSDTAIPTEPYHQCHIVRLTEDVVCPSTSAMRFDDAINVLQFLSERNFRSVVREIGRSEVRKIANSAMLDYLDNK